MTHEILESYKNFWDSADVISEESSTEDDSTTMSTSRPKEDSANAAGQTSQLPASGAVSSPHKVPPRACYQSTHVKIEVGPKKKVYVLHRDLVIFYSDYFRGAFNGSFKEATEGKISLPEECEDVFDIFNQFIYSRRISDEEDTELRWNLLIRVWLFGDKYMVPSLQNAVLNVLTKKREITNVIPTGNIYTIWENTLPASPLRKWILNDVAYRLDIAELRLYEDQWPREALFDLLEVFANKEGARKFKSPKRGKCYYHIHKEGEKC